MRTRATLAVGILLLVTAGVARAQSAVIEVVVLHDGSTYQGELVEKVVPDHVTIKLATGEVRRFAWADIASTQELGGAAAGSPSPSPSPLAPGLGATHVITDWPEPDRSAPVFDGEHLTLGVEGGYGAPEGYDWVFAGYEPTSWLELEVGGGTGGAYGPAISETLRVGFTVLDLFRMGLGGGFSQNFTGGDYTKLGAPSLSNWVNTELYFDVVLGRHFLIRTSVGAAFMTNPHGFGVLCEGKNPLPSCMDFDFTGGPVTAGEDVAMGSSVVWLTYGSVRLAWMFDL